MHPMTADNLRSAFSGESQAHMRYLVYAERAAAEKLPNVARLFEAIGWAEKIHASNHFRELRDEVGPATTVAHAGFGLGTTGRNLDVAVAGEEFEIAEMYPAYKSVADAQGEKGPLRSFDWAYQAEQTHAAIFRQARAAVESGQDWQASPVRVCAICGHTVVGDAPDRCPICNASRDKYRAFV